MPNPIPEYEHSARSYDLSGDGPSKLQPLLDELGSNGWQIGAVLSYTQSKEIKLILSRPTGRNLREIDKPGEKEAYRT